MLFIQIDNAKDTDLVMPMYDLIEYSDNYSKTSWSLWQCCKDKPAVNNNGAVVDFNVASVTDLFSFKEKVTGRTVDDGTKDVEITIKSFLENSWNVFNWMWN